MGNNLPKGPSCFDSIEVKFLSRLSSNSSLLLYAVLLHFICYCIGTANKNIYRPVLISRKKSFTKAVYIYETKNVFVIEYRERREHCYDEWKIVQKQTSLSSFGSRPGYSRIKISDAIVTMWRKMQLRWIYGCPKSWYAFQHRVVACWFRDNNNSVMNKTLLYLGLIE